MIEQPIIRLAQVGKTYIKDKKPIVALQPIDLSIGRGEFVAITGPSGGGKSTLLHVMGGLERPSTGNVFVSDIDLAQLSDAELSDFRNKQLGFVFQDASLQPFLTVAQNIQLPAMFGVSKDQNHRVEELASIVGLQDRLHHFPHELSGGQAQRCAIARALFNQPSIICADEPTGNLDPANTATIMDLFKRVQSELKTTIVIVTHDTQLAGRAERVLNIEAGKLNG